MMNVKKILMLAAILMVAVWAGAQKRYVRYVPKGGTLSKLISPSEAAGIRNLELQGKVNAVDFRYLRDSFPNLGLLNLSGASIVRYTGREGTEKGFTVYKANSIPAYAFCPPGVDSTRQTGGRRLRTVVLPKDIKVIGQDAFKGCGNLYVLKLSQSEPPMLEPGALADTLTAVFVPDGCSDAYQMSEEWKRFAVVDGKAVRARVRVGNGRTLEGELMRAGLQPREVCFLSVTGRMSEDDFLTVRNYMPRLVEIDLSRCNAESIPPYTFSQKRYLLHVQLPSALKRIGQRAFSGCGRLAGTLTLPPGVVAIEDGAFIGCDHLRQVLVTGTAPTTLGENLFGEEPSRLVYATEGEDDGTGNSD